MALVGECSYIWPEAGSLHSSGTPNGVHLAANMIVLKNLLSLNALLVIDWGLDRVRFRNGTLDIPPRTH